MRKAGGTFSATVPLAPDSAWQTANPRAVVLVQEPTARRVEGCWRPARARLEAAASK